MQQTIPVVNLADFTKGNDTQKTTFVQQLGMAYEDVGFVAVEQHGIPEQLISQLYEEVKAFFALPESVKRKYDIAALNGQRGYTAFGKEHAKHSSTGDLKEFFQFGQTVVGDITLKTEYPENIDVAERPLFLNTAIAAYKAFEHSGMHLLQAIALYLGLDKNYFDNRIKNGNSILRAIHYPPIIHDPGTALRSEQHEDINLITLLVGASAEGLQVLNMQGQWVPISALPGQIVVNVGDMLQRLTNNKLKSTTHRVVNPPQELWHTSRFSIPFFLHPRSEMRLDCLESCIDNTHPLAYAPISAGEYLDERLVEIGLKK